MQGRTFIFLVIFPFTVESALPFPSARPNSFSGENSASSKIGYGSVSLGRPAPPPRSAYRDSSFASSALREDSLPNLRETSPTYTKGLMRATVWNHYFQHFYVHQKGGYLRVSKGTPEKVPNPCSIDSVHDLLCRRFGNHRRRQQHDSSRHGMPP